jgi:hypothetical protein
VIREEISSRRQIKAQKYQKIQNELDQIKMKEENLLNKLERLQNSIATDSNAGNSHTRVRNAPNYLNYEFGHPASSPLPIDRGNIDIEINLRPTQVENKHLYPVEA